MKLLLTLLALLLWYNSGAQVLSMKEAVKLSLEHNPLLAYAQAKKAESKAVHKQARSLYLPQVNVAAADFYLQNIGKRQQGGLQNDENFFYALGGVEQLIYDFGATGNQIDASFESEKASQYAYEAKRNQVVFGVVYAYYNALKQKKLIEIYSEKIGITKQQHFRAEQYYKQGLVNKIDVTDAQVQLSKAQLMKMNADHNFKVAKVRLNKSIGIAPGNGDYQLDETDRDIHDLLSSVATPEKGLIHYRDEAMLSRPEIKQYGKLVSAAQHDEDSKSSGYYPKVVGFAGYLYLDIPMPMIQQGLYAGGLAEWNLFTGFRVEAEIEEAEAQKLQVKAKLADLKLSIEQEVTEAYLSILDRKKEMELSYLIVTQAEENFNQASQRYKSGLSGIVEFNDAQANYIEAKSTFVSMYYDYMTALERMKYATGEYVKP